jgi:transcriptional regulator with XRE-family HTH domain
VNRGARLLREAKDTAGKPISQGQIAKRLDVSQAAISQFMTSAKRPAEDMRRRLREAFAIPFEAWDEELDEAEASGKASRTKTPPSPSPPPELGPIGEELDASAARLKAQVLGGGLTASQKGTLEGKLAAVLCKIADKRLKGGIQDHPEFAEHVADTFEALEATLREFGVEPNGARTVFAERLAAIEGARARKVA